MTKPVCVPDLIRFRERGEKIVALTAYDYTFARLLDQAGVDIILVGDSLGTVIQGHPTTLPVTLDQMVYHSSLVARGAKRALVIADMPFLSYQLGPTEALRSAGRLVKEAGVAGVKIEGVEGLEEVVRTLCRSGIPVMGHLGLLPQSYYRMGGYHVQGRTQSEQDKLLAGAKALEAAGAFLVVLEGIPAELAGRITEAISIPTLGIGAGPHCTGQILVLYDLLGLTHLEKGSDPKFVRRFSEFAHETLDAVQSYGEAVRSGAYPGPEHSY